MISDEVLEVIKGSDSLGNLKESCRGCGKIRIVMEERKGI